MKISNKKSAQSQWMRCKQRTLFD